MIAGLLHELPRWLWLGFVAGMMGCAAPSFERTQPQVGQYAWSGRMLLKADTSPPARFTATFELNGSVQQGRLVLATPLGTTLATIHWRPGMAELHSSGDVRYFVDLNTLTTALTGTQFPLTALFSWLDGRDAATVDGWQADLSRLNVGLLTAQQQASPQTTIKLILSPPWKTQP